jgi:hypothetical protein
MLGAWQGDFWWRLAGAALFLLNPHMGCRQVPPLAGHGARQGPPGHFPACTGEDNPKREKDVTQAAVLAAALARDQDFVLKEAIDAMDRTLRARAGRGQTRTRPTGTGTPGGGRDARSAGLNHPCRIASV